MRKTYAIIKFGLIDTTASTDGVITSNGATYFSDLTDLEESNDEIKIMSCEKNHSILNGNYELVNTSHSYSYWSSAVSDSNGNFSTNPKLTKTFTQYHTTAGLTFAFQGDSLPKSMILTYYNGNTVLDTFTYQPNEFIYIAQGLVENYNKLEVTFTGTNIPSRHIKLLNWVWGVGKVWKDTEIITGKLMQEVNLISNEFPTDELEFTILDKLREFDITNPQGIATALQEKQVMEVYEHFNGTENMVGKYYLNEWSGDLHRIQTFRANDAIGLLDKSYYRQSTMWNNTSATTILQDIFSQANFSDYIIDGSITGLTLYGYVPISTTRDVLQEVCLALKAVAYCNEQGKLVVKRVISTLSYTTISDNAKLNTKLTQEALVNRVAVNAYNYTLGSSEQLYSESLPAGTYEITVDPSSTKTCTGATINSQGLSYVIITVASAGTVTINGAKYIENTMKYTKRATIYNELQEVEIKDIHCISKNNGQSVADWIYSDYQNRLTQEFTLLRTTEKITDQVNVTIQDTSKIGRITKLDTDLAKGFISECTVRGVQ